MDLFYILTYVMLICGCFYFILYNIANAIGTTNSSGSLVHVHNRVPFSSLVLASWDFSINTAEVRWGKKFHHCLDGKKLLLFPSSRP